MSETTGNSTDAKFEHSNNVPALSDLGTDAFGIRNHPAFDMRFTGVVWRPLEHDKDWEIRLQLIIVGWTVRRGKQTLSRNGAPINRLSVAPQAPESTP